MQRSLQKSWDDRRRARPGGPYQSWARRVCWYEGADVRLQFEDAAGVYNKFYPLEQRAGAQADYDRFRRGEAVTGCAGGRCTLPTLEPDNQETQR